MWVVSICHDYFNPRSPRGERQLCVPGEVQRIQISIHAPRGGSDLIQYGSTVYSELHFNPRSPRGERLNYGKVIALN